MEERWDANIHIERDEEVYATVDLVDTSLENILALGRVA